LSCFLSTHRSNLSVLMLGSVQLAVRLYYTKVLNTYRAINSLFIVHIEMIREFIPRHYAVTR